MPPTRGTRALCFVEENMEDVELLVPRWWLEDAGVQVTVAGREKRAYKGKKGHDLKADATLAEVAGQAWDLVHIPGGFAPDKLRTYPEVLELVRRQDQQGKPLAAICHAGWVLASAGIVRGRRLTSYWSIQDDLVNAGARWVDEPVVVDRNLVTSRHPPDLPAYCRALVEQLEAKREAPVAR